MTIYELSVCSDIIYTFIGIYNQSIWSIPNLKVLHKSYYSECELYVRSYISCVYIP